MGHGQNLLQPPRIGHRTLVEGRRGMHLPKYNKFCPLPDLGKRKYTMAIIGLIGKIAIHKGTTMEKGQAALYSLLEKSDKVALEAGNLAFKMAREMTRQVGCEVRVLNPSKLPMI